MRKVTGLGLVASVALALVTAVPVAATARTSVHMEVATNFDPADDPFTADIASCTSGLVATGDNLTTFTRTHGNFVGYKLFDCGGGSGFTVRLNALFGSDGSTGTWAITDAWGALAGLRGSGKLIGIPAGENEIHDIYDGTIN